MRIEFEPVTEQNRDIALKLKTAAGRAWLDRFLIDADFQGKGCARACFPLLPDRIRKEYGCSAIYLSVIKENRPQRGGRYGR